MSKFSFKKISKNEAMKFWESSPQATAFTNPKILSYFNLNIDWWQSKKGEQPIAIWPVNISENNNGCFINLSDLDDDTIDKLCDFLKFLNEQIDTLNVIEDKKKNMKSKYFN